MGSRARDPPVGRHATILVVLVAFLTLAVGPPVGSTATDGWPSDDAQKVETWAPSGANIVRLRGTLEAADEPPLPPEGTEHVVLTSESNLGNPDALLSLVLSFRKHHDASTGKVVLLSTASRAKDRTKWTSWAETAVPKNSIRLAFYSNLSQLRPDPLQQLAEFSVALRAFSAPSLRVAVLRRIAPHAQSLQLAVQRGRQPLGLVPVVDLPREHRARGRELSWLWCEMRRTPSQTP